MSELPYLVCVADPDQLVQHIPSPVLNVEKKGPPRKKPKSTPACEQTTMPGAARCGRGVSATVAVQVQVQRGPGGHAQRWIEQSRTTGERGGKCLRVCIGGDWAQSGFEACTGTRRAHPALDLLIYHRGNPKATGCAIVSSLVAQPACPRPPHSIICRHRITGFPQDNRVSTGGKRCGRDLLVVVIPETTT